MCWYAFRPFGLISADNIYGRWGGCPIHASYLREWGTLDGLVGHCPEHIHAALSDQLWYFLVAEVLARPSDNFRG